MCHGPLFPGETGQDGSNGAIRCKASIGHILLGSRTRKMSCFGFYTPEATRPLERRGLVPFSRSLCGEGREYITFSREELEAGISHLGNQPRSSAETHQVAVSAQTSIALVFESVTDRFWGLCMLGTGTCS